MTISGRCHCGNIGYDFETGIDIADFAVRACGCSFCTKHAGRWISDPAGTLRVQIADLDKVEDYRFGHRTADFHVCKVCGVVPFATSEIGGTIYGIVNANTADDAKSFKPPETVADLEGEGTGDRLARRARNWISTVTFLA